VENIEILKQALPYIKRFREKTFVVKLGGEVLSDRDDLDRLMHDISLLHELSIRVVIIHGGGAQLSKVAKQLGIESEKINGRRITDDKMLEVAKMVFAGGVSTDILASLRRHGTPGVGLSGVDGDLLHATRRPKSLMVDRTTGEEREVDFQNVGDISAVRPEILRVLLANRFVPVVASLGADKDGKVFNINADTIAARIAASLPAEKLFLLSNVNGVLGDIRDPESRISCLAKGEGEQLLEAGRVSGGMLPKLAAGLDAVENGVPRVHIINGLAPSALLREVFTDKGIGTMIVKEKEKEKEKEEEKKEEVEEKHPQQEEG
jgi:acetylglutamate kinase